MELIAYKAVKLGFMEIYKLESVCNVLGNVFLVAQEVNVWFVLLIYINLVIFVMKIALKEISNGIKQWSV